MVISCSAHKCVNRQTSRSHISFHRFPQQDETRKQQWIEAMQRKNWKPTKYSYLCSDHFVPEDYSPPDAAGRRILKATAVPSVFGFPLPARRPHLSKAYIPVPPKPAECKRCKEKASKIKRLEEKVHRYQMERKNFNLRMKRREDKMRSLLDIIDDLQNRTLITCENDMLAIRCSDTRLQLLQKECKTECCDDDSASAVV